MHKKRSEATKTNEQKKRSEQEAKKNETRNISEQGRRIEQQSKKNETQQKKRLEPPKINETAEKRQKISHDNSSKYYIFFPFCY